MATLSCFHRCRNMRKPEDADLPGRNQGGGSVKTCGNRAKVCKNSEADLLEVGVYQTATAAAVSEGPYSLPAVM